MDGGYGIWDMDVDGWGHKWDRDRATETRARLGSGLSNAIYRGWMSVGVPIRVERLAIRLES